MSAALRCPYCHLDVAGRIRAVCSCCRAAAHTACAIELGRCAACSGPILALGGLSAEGWERVAAGVGDGQAVAFVGTCRREPPACEGETTDPISLRLDVLRRHELQDGALAGVAVLMVPRTSDAGELTLELLEERFRPGLFGVRVRRRVLRRVRVLGAAPRAHGLQRLLGRGGRGLYAPGTYSIPFRLPLDGVAPTRDRPGASEQRRLSLVLRLDRRGGAFQAAMEVVVEASPEASEHTVDSGHVPDRSWLESARGLPLGGLRES